MVMTDVFDKLKMLQDILAEKYAIEALINDSPKKLSTQEELLSRLKKEYIEKNTIYEELRAKAAKLRSDLAEAEHARERGEKGMDNITTHREYEALDKEIRDATELEQQIRRDLQKEEKNLAELNENLKQDEQLIGNQEAELNTGKASLANEIENYKSQLQDLTVQESEITPSIDPEIIFKFERIIKSKQNKGIVAVRGNVCDGCHMILPAQFANEVRAGEDIVFCPYCSRILYFQEVEGGETEYFHIDDTGSLADLEDDFEDDDSEMEEEESDDRESRDDIKDLGFDE
jgi:hypothetical protein